jgi:hypothetical protein
MLTNRLGLPEAIVRAVHNDKYNPGDGNISVTGLIQPPQLRRLSHDHEKLEDVSDRIWSLVGQAVHGILERAHEGIEGYEVETRLYTEVAGWKIGGQFDVYDRENETLDDYKITTVWSRDGKDEWTQQLNMLRVLCEDNGRPVKHLRIIAIFRDWQRAKAGTHDYPDSQVKVIEVPVWPIETARGFMEGRVRLHQAETPRPCTDEERWVRPAVFAVMKVGRKSAVKLFDKLPEAEKFIEKSSDKKLLDVQHRTKTFTRCEGYCPVSHVCPQLAAEKDDRPF